MTYYSGPCSYIRSMTVLSLFTEYPFVALLYKKYKCHCWSHGHMRMKSNSAWSLLQNIRNSISKVYTYMHIAQEVFTSIYIMHGTVHLHFHPWHRVLVRSLYKPLPAAVLEKVKWEEHDYSVPVPQFADCCSAVQHCGQCLALQLPTQEVLAWSVHTLLIMQLWTVEALETFHPTANEKFTGMCHWQSKEVRTLQNSCTWQLMHTGHRAWVQVWM